MERITSKIENQNEMILNAQRAVAETEELGNDIVEELKGNREKIVSVRVRKCGYSHLSATNFFGNANLR